MVICWEQIRALNCERNQSKRPLGIDGRQGKDMWDSTPLSQKVQQTFFPSVYLYYVRYLPNWPFHSIIIDDPTTRHVAPVINILSPSLPEVLNYLPVWALFIFDQWENTRQPSSEVQRKGNCWPPKFHIILEEKKKKKTLLTSAKSFLTFKKILAKDWIN